MKVVTIYNFRLQSMDQQSSNEASQKKNKDKNNSPKDKPQPPQKQKVESKLGNESKNGTKLNKQSSKKGLGGLKAPSGGSGKKDNKGDQNSGGDTPGSQSKNTQISQSKGPVSDQKSQNKEAKGNQQQENLKNTGGKNDQQGNRPPTHDGSVPSQSDGNDSDKPQAKSEMSKASRKESSERNKDIVQEIRKTSDKEVLIQHSLGIYQWRQPRIDSRIYQAEITPIKQYLENIPDHEEILNKEKVQLGKRPYQEVVEDAQITTPSQNKRQTLEDFNQRQPTMKEVFMGEDKLEVSTEAEENKQEVQNQPESKFSDSFQHDSQANQSQFEDYLKLVNFIMTEASASTTGPISKGGTQFEEQAIKMLSMYDYNYTMAKFHIIYPSLMITNPELVNNLTQLEMSQMVNQAVNDLIGCKQEERERAINDLRSQISKKITLEDLESNIEYLNSIRVEVPQDILKEQQQVIEFSKTLKKKFQDKMSMNDLISIKERAYSHSILTPEIQNVSDFVERAEKWRQKVADIENKSVNIKTLQSLQNEQKLIPVKFSEVNKLKDRCSKGQETLDKLHKMVNKNNKTRQSGPKTTSQKIDHVILKNERKCTEESIKKCLTLLDNLKVYNSESVKTRQEISDIELWKNRMEMILEDERTPKTKDSLSQYMKEAQLFRFEVVLVKCVQNKLDYLEWKEKLKSIIQKPEDSTDQILTIDKVSIQKPIKELMKQSCLKKLLQEGKDKGFSKREPDYQKLEDLDKKAESYRLKVKKIQDLSDSDSHSDDNDDENISSSSKSSKKDTKEQSVCPQKLAKLAIKHFSEDKDTIQVKELQELLIEGYALNLFMEEIEYLQDKIGKAQLWDEKCSQVWGNGQDSIFDVKQEDDIEIEDQDIVQQLQTINQLIKQSNKIRVQTEERTKLDQKIQPTKTWIDNADKFINNFQYQSQKEEEGTTPALITTEKQPQQVISSRQIQLPSSTEVQRAEKNTCKYTELVGLLTGQNQVVTQTKQFKKLQALKTLSDNWASTQISLEFDGLTISDIEKKILSIKQLVKQQKQFPVLKSRLLNLYKYWQTFAWVRMFRVVNESEQIKIKQLDTLVKEGSGIDKSENTEFDSIFQRLQKSYKECKEWLQQYKKVNEDYEKSEQRGNIATIRNLLAKGRQTDQEEGSQQFVTRLKEFRQMNGYYQEIKMWQDEARERMSRHMTLDELVDSIYKAKDFYLELKELDILKALKHVYDKWERNASKLYQATKLTLLFFEDTSSCSDDSYGISKFETPQRLSNPGDEIRIIISPIGSEKVIEDITIGNESILKSSSHQSSAAVSAPKRIIKESLKKKEAKESQMQYEQLLNQKLAQSKQDTQVNNKKRKNKEPIQHLESHVLDIQHLSSLSDDSQKREYVKQNFTLKKEDEIDNYCICRRSDDGINQMIACDSCDQWFHINCIGVLASKVDSLGEYNCIVCSKRRGRPYVVEREDGVIEYVRPKVAFEIFLKLITDGDRIPMHIPLLVKLRQQLKDIEDWVKLHSNLFEDIQNKRPTKDEENNIMNLLYQYAGLPVYLKDKEKELYDRLTLKEWFDEAQKCANSKSPHPMKAKKLLQMVKHVQNGEISTSVSIPNNSNGLDIDHIQGSIDLKAILHRISQTPNAIEQKILDLKKRVGRQDEYLSLIKEIDKTSYQSPSVSSIRQKYSDFITLKKKAKGYLESPKIAFIHFDQLEQEVTQSQITCDLFLKVKEYVENGRKWENEVQQVLFNKNKLGLDKVEDLLTQYQDMKINFQSIYYDQLVGVYQDLQDGDSVERDGVDSENNKEHGNEVEMDGTAAAASGANGGGAGAVAGTNGQVDEEMKTPIKDSQEFKIHAQSITSQHASKQSQSSVEEMICKVCAKMETVDEVEVHQMKQEHEELFQQDGKYNCSLLRVVEKDDILLIDDAQPLNVSPVKLRRNYTCHDCRKHLNQI